MACNVCRDKGRHKVLHLSGEGGKPLCRSARTEFPLIEGCFETWVKSGNRCKACARLTAGNPGPDRKRKKRRG